MYGKNSLEWFISALGSIQQSIVIVPLYDTLGPEAAIFAVQQTEIRYNFFDLISSFFETNKNTPLWKTSTFKVVQ